MLFSAARLARTIRHSQGVSAEHEAEYAGNDKLVAGVLELYAVGILYEVHEEHTADEADCTEYAYRREVLYRILSAYLEGVVGHGVGNGDSRHKESHAEKVKGVEWSEGYS